MIKHYFTIAWRNLTKNSGFSLINLAGLSIGMAASALIFLWVNYEHSIDDFHINKDRIYQAWNKTIHNGEISCWSVTPQIMAKTIQKDYNEIELTARQNWTEEYLFAFDDIKIKGKTTFVDAGFTHMFSFNFLQGDKNTCLIDPTSMVLTRSFAKKLFGDLDPMGKNVHVDQQHIFKVSGIIDDLPSNTLFEFETLLPFSFMTQNGFTNDYWGNNSTTTWVMVRENTNIENLQAKIKPLRKSYDQETANWETFLYPLRKLSLYGRFKNGIETGGKITIVRTFTVIAFLILLIACINFMNLSTARSEKRAKEVGIRKVAGAHKNSLIRLFLSESILLSFLAGVIALFIIQFSLNPFNEMLGKKISIDWLNPNFIIGGSMFALLTGILAGSYPALFLSNFKPAAVLKGSFKKIGSDITPRKILVVSQFVFSIILIASTLIIKKQIDHAQSREQGYEKGGLVYHPLEGDMNKNYALIKNEMIQSGIAESVTLTFSPITDAWSNTSGMNWKGKDPEDRTLIDRFSADDAVTRTLGFQLIQGRDFDLKNFPSDSTAAIINETAMKKMGLTNPIGQIIEDDDIKMNIIGVVKDFIIRSPYRPINPIVIAGIKRGVNILHVKYNSKKPMKNNLTSAEKIFKKYNPNFPFTYKFVDEEYAKKFSDEKRISAFAFLFAFLTIFISCLGLLGLAAYMAQNRIKELGIRKVLGASTLQIITLLSKDFLLLVSIAFFLGSPIAYWFMNKWLMDYDYRIQIGWGIFGMAGFIAILIATITVSSQALRAAWMNPTSSLRSE